jgi:hypothetical protein
MTGERKVKSKKEKGKSKSEVRGSGTTASLRMTIRSTARSFVPRSGTQDDRESAQGECPGAAS